jgi:hypothetical protein
MKKYKKHDRIIEGQKAKLYNLQHDTTKAIPLTRGYITIVDTEYYGQLMEHTWCFNGLYASRSVMTNRCSKSIFLHHEVLKLDNRFNRDLVCDHINRDKLLNTKANLRSATKQLNKLNSKRVNKSGFVGAVKIRDGVYQSQIKINGFYKYLGRYTTPEQASLAYCQAFFNYYGFNAIT